MLTFYAYHFLHLLSLALTMLPTGHRLLIKVKILSPAFVFYLDATANWSRYYSLKFSKIKTWQMAIQFSLLKT